MGRFPPRTDGQVETLPVGGGSDELLVSNNKDKVGRHLDQALQQTSTLDAVYLPPCHFLRCFEEFGGFSSSGGDVTLRREQRPEPRNIRVPINVPIRKFDGRNRSEHESTCVTKHNGRTRNVQRSKSRPKHRDI